jgi:phage head maturation protease
LEEVQLIFDDPNGVRYIGTPAWKTKKATKGMQEVERGNVSVGKMMVDDEKSGDEEAGTVEVKRA